MAVVQAQISGPNDQCPNLIFTDTTDYSSIQTIAQYKFIDYDLGTPAGPATDILLTIGTLPPLDADIVLNIEFSVDAGGDLVDALNKYNLLVDTINAANVGYQARLIQPDTLDFKTWVVELFSFDLAYQGAGLNPLYQMDTFTDFRTNFLGGETINLRNLAILQPDNTYADLGSISQIDSIQFLTSSYTVGETFTLSWCGTDLIYTVEDGLNSRSCVIDGIVSLISSQTDNLFSNVTAVADGNNITITSNIPGFALQISILYSVSPSNNFVTISTVTGNSSNMVPPGINISNELIFTPQSPGGLYKAQLLVLSGCDYNISEIEFYNWCYDKQQLDNCLIEKVQDSICKCGCCKDDLCDAASLYSKIQTINLMEELNYPGQSIQKVVDDANSMCDCLNCSSFSNSNDCGCG